MNIVYKFTSKVTSKFYIGSKTECEVLNGKILDRRGFYYFSSCRDVGFWEELSQGHLELEILEKGILRDNLLEREAYWQQHYNFKNDNCWNQVLATQLHPSMSKSVLFKVRNRFGQNTKEIAVHNSTIARLESSAISEGFDNNGVKMFKMLTERKNNFKSYREMDDFYNRKGYFKRYLKGCCLEDFDIEVDIFAIKEYMREGATFIKACELLDYPVYVARYCIGKDFKDLLNKDNLLAESSGFLSRVDFNNQILRDFLKGATRTYIASKYNNITNSTVSRILDVEFRKRLNINDIG